MMDAMEGDLLDMGQTIVEVGVDEGASSIDGICGRVRCQLEGLQLHHQGWQSHKQKSYQDKDSGNQNKGVPGIHLTCDHGVRFGQPCSSSAGLFFSGMKGGLRDPEVGLKH